LPYERETVQLRKNKANWDYYTRLLKMETEADDFWAQ
jgi:hypothetical protein